MNPHLEMYAAAIDEIGKEREPPGSARQLADGSSAREQTNRRGLNSAQPLARIEWVMGGDECHRELE